MLAELCSQSRPGRDSVCLLASCVSSNLGISWFMAYPVLILTFIPLWPSLLSVCLLIRTPVILINIHPVDSSTLSGTCEYLVSK